MRPARPPPRPRAPAPPGPAPRAPRPAPGPPLPLLTPASGAIPPPAHPSSLGPSPVLLRPPLRCQVSLSGPLLAFVGLRDPALPGRPQRYPASHFSPRVPHAAHCKKEKVLQKRLLKRYLHTSFSKAALELGPTC
ncbi:vegetative cell wall protein gp1-like [Pteropus medius]|uniref:vegetative cell wall protein gp1-like n=1 Tax=Pteropus vampyrus TaxID=132908 RepID=UPI00196A23F2|nr:vegetative cell wall protein gp1-like [Pteropus giganteus]